MTAYKLSEKKDEKNTLTRSQVLILTNQKPNYCGGIHVQTDRMDPAA
ncbi:Uncharacterised protein [Legionella lansingensis]|nr:Uncharacterised protein [Legionella lansingensis]